MTSIVKITQRNSACDSCFNSASNKEYKAQKGLIVLCSNRPGFICKQSKG